MQARAHSSSVCACRGVRRMQAHTKNDDDYPNATRTSLPSHKRRRMLMSRSAAIIVTSQLPTSERGQRWSQSPHRIVSKQKTETWSHTGLASARMCRVAGRRRGSGTAGGDGACPSCAAVTHRSASETNASDTEDCEK
jgi:hypothetical protein